MVSVLHQGKISFDRINEYARATKIIIHKCSQHSSWQKLGLPDLRGFTPHLRTVNVNKETDSLWIMHDMLHIIFYDFVNLSLGDNSWLTYERFIENHLASEAFAVLLLDYHLLPKQGLESLASDFKGADWPKFQKNNPHLPDFDSSSFVKLLTELYLSNNQKPICLDNPKVMSQPSYKKWIGHEVRYARQPTSQKLFVNLLKFFCMRKNLIGRSI
jgi:hypothetical protein